VVVSEAGASVYSASEYASKELPELDVSLRGAVSIARRLQDPLAELVKIDPKSIGVGQYQHDVNQSELAKSLDAVIEDCVNSVGVDLNTASAPLLSRVSGPERCGGIEHRALARCERRLPQPPATAGRGRPGRQDLRAGAGFLRIRDGDNPLDHVGRAPGDLPGGRAILAAVKRPIAEVMGRSDVIRTLKPEAFADDGSASSPSRTSWPSWKSRAATRARTSRWRASTTALRTSRTCRRA
jgi:uncharacterized protein